MKNPTMILPNVELPIQEKTMTREQFEQWICTGPYNRNIARWPNNANANVWNAWPGQYKEYEVQLAWEAVQESNRLRAAEKKGPLRRLYVTLGIRATEIDEAWVESTRDGDDV